ncbi:similar to Saccharomyces cerevisiae YGL116W CDC20 Cell-cycle regulated activator of anaphase-promoting complex/cyclosome (APC/C), which is required for metaphase/anaphase transition [Maudiozyma barnettii]|uniref:Similar to Saccharomyces cerevisiae YGL116W CDC20 Cell-cycle regulated activator of anaphase-promoting complex/cyclosome (APC/C), which is required for metaphase/anaphase transition n=1 Tax=Maudiozyma barnettii TaxID=61262 RepID=A0A8H2ZJN6_9SACH|nr:ubiquitin-protein transferase activating protein CDC20 [Kazachstania barnettii]CAB4257228.1 similar to Saccharomyces cerevisiae YGL116W CDC20 Cell-cycle regulated activator of anaphase-promoting complex/cyclosome (APC/C), which is required for metaphase/anaphase transition [Kazachstania barnettii]CAD1779598.1 similar to Saccharomyces cerevisiae YGL116W CDC20 Cell-cycle regulated activator of anaphase-promoting complex/cyclosome (APC/C), which is required for metaphase/anaphase transition [Kaza
MKSSNNPHRSVLSTTSPAKLNVISERRPGEGKVSKLSLTRTSSLDIRPRMPQFNRPTLTKGNRPQLLRRNSSFFKCNEFTKGEDDDDDDNDNDETLPSGAGDRFIPLLQNGMQARIDHRELKEELPPPDASPVTHLRAQKKCVFKTQVAQACGLNVNERILQYLPQPPVANFKRYEMKSRSQFRFDSNDNESPMLLKLRKIGTNPERILDAPGFQDDFYLNLLSWSRRNILAIALESSLYLWNATSGQVSLLTELEGALITSVTWSDDDCHISVGTDNGNTQVWDTETSSKVRTMRSGLGVRIGSQSWLETLIATGSRSGEIQINDVRVRDHIVSRWDRHEGEVCGLAYKCDGTQLASGGNDNTVILWDTRNSMPIFTKRAHNAAVKAISWCPYIPNLLATGGGQADKHIHFWNTTTGNKLGSINTGSQVSSLHWGQSYSSAEGPNSAMHREIVATGGNPSNAISVFDYDTKYKVAEIPHAHETRICGSQLSPDGTTLATVGGDENLKFFKVFDPRRAIRRRTKTALGPLPPNEHQELDPSTSQARTDYIIR